MSPRLSDLLLRSQSDERLVSLARAGQDRAFTAIVQRYRPELLALARRLTSDGRAEDVLQQAFLSAFAALRSGAEVQHLRGWLYQIVRNAATKVKPPADLALDHVDVVGESLEETVLRRARALAAMSELARLPERQRGALVATALGDRAHAEVALSMEISEQAVRQLVHRARATLRRAVTGITPWPLAKWLTTAPNAASAPEVAVGAGAASSTGVVVKLGVLFATTGALASGVAIGPLHQADDSGLGRAPVTHVRHPSAHGVAPTLRAASVEAARIPRARPKAASTRSGRADRSTGPVSPSRAVRGSRLTVVTTTSPGRATVEDLTAERREDASAPERQATGSSDNGRQPAANPSDGAGSSGHDGMTASGSSAGAGGGSDGASAGTDGGSNPEAHEPDGDLATGHGDTPSQSDGAAGVTTADSSAVGSGPSATRGDSDGGSTISDGGESAQSRSGSDSTVSDTSPEGK